MSCIHKRTKPWEPHLAGARKCLDCTMVFNPNRTPQWFIEGPSPEQEIARLRQELSDLQEASRFGPTAGQLMEKDKEIEQLRAAKDEITAQCDEWMLTALKGVGTVNQMSDLFQRDRLVPASSKGENHGGEGTGEQAWPPPPLLEMIDRIKARNARLTRERDAEIKNSVWITEQMAQLDERVENYTRAIRWAMTELEVAKAECHQPMVALKPWIDGDPDRAHLDLAHLSACSFRAWGSVKKTLAILKIQVGEVPAEPPPKTCETRV